MIAWYLYPSKRKLDIYVIDQKSAKVGEVLSLGLRQDWAEEDAYRFVKDNFLSDNGSKVIDAAKHIGADISRK